MKYLHDCTLVRVCDGDTIVVDEHLVRDLWCMGETCRLARINAPELSTPEGQAAKKWLEEFLTVAKQRLVVQGLKREKYGRVLTELYVDMGDAMECVNDAIVAAGHAVYKAYGCEDEDVHSATNVTNVCEV